MKHTLHRLLGYLNGTYTIDDSFKCSLFCYTSAIVHIIITVIFISVDVAPMYYFNSFSTVLYLYMAFILVRKELYSRVYLISLSEVLVQSIFATFIVGWNWGYMGFVIALIPITFYISLSLPALHKHPFAPLAICSLICILYIITKVISSQYPPLYQDIAPESFVLFCYCLNMLITFSLILVFSVLFTMEVRQMQRKLMQEYKTLDEIASHDPLTKLLNRRSMEQHLEHVMEVAKKTGSQFGLIMCDIDDFKKINDTYGHDVGDEVLIHVADIFRSQMRGNDYVCRWGGEEILLLINNNGKVTTRVAERIRQTLENTPYITKDGHKITITMTFGVTGYIPGFSINKLIKITDENLYKGKRNGKNQVVS